MCQYVEKSSGTKPSSLGDFANLLLDEATVEKISDTYWGHPIIMAIKLSVTQNNKFNLPQDIDKIINSLSSDKATGPDGISVKFIKLSANVIDSHLANIRNKDIDLNCYSENAKIANVRPIFKKDERTKVKSYRPVSLLNVFSKIYESYIHENLTPFVNLFLSKFISAYRKT